MSVIAWCLSMSAKALRKTKHLLTRREKLLIFMAIASSSAYLMAIQAVKIILPFILKEAGVADMEISRVLYVGLLLFVFLPPIAGH